jgi:FtsZ-binding cell division protein ZapB
MNMKRPYDTQPRARVARALSKMLTQLALPLALCAPLSSASLSAQNQPNRGLSELRTQVQEYTELQRIIASAESEWRIDQSFMADSIKLLSIELETIKEDLENFKDTGTETQEKMESLEDRKDELVAAADRISEAIVELEGRIKQLALRLPPPLKERIEPLMRRIPDDPDSPRAPAIGERLQNIVGVLSVTEKFNTSLHNFGEIQTIDGKQQQVATIYLGLAASFSINADADVATVGYPTEDGWEQVSKPELAPAIQRFLEAYDGVREPEFVPLQVEIR